MALDRSTIAGLAVLAVIVGGAIWWNSVSDPPKPPPSREQIEARNEELKRKLADTRQKARAALAPGWYDLMDCVPFTSLDGSKTLMLNVDNTVRTAEPEGPTGRWEFDKDKERYTVTLGGVSRTYFLVNAETAGVCVLAAGDP